MKKRISKVAVSLFLAFTLVLSAATPASAAVNFYGYYETAANGASKNVEVRVKSTTANESKIKYTVQNLKNKKSKSVTTQYTKQRIELYRNVWYKTTIRGYNSYGTNVSKKTSYWAHEPVIKLSISGSNKIKVSWASVYGSDKYQVYMSSDGGSTFKKVKTTSGTSYTTGALQKYKTYYFYVRALNKVYSTTYYSAKPYSAKGGYIYTKYY